MYRFQVGHSYALRTNPAIPNLRAGDLTVLAEIKPLDGFNTRSLLCEVWFSDGGQPASLKGVVAYVEEGYAEINNGYRAFTIPAEILQVSGYPAMTAKAYATDDEGMVAR